MRPRALIFIYHAILAPDDEGGSLDPQDRAYAVRWDDWTGQLDALAGCDKFRFARFGSKRGEEGDDREREAIVLTFDDSWEQHFSVAAPELKRRGLPAIFFITTAQLGQPGYMDNRQVNELSQSGFAIGSHGTTHHFLNTLGIDELRNELLESKKILEDLTGKEIRHLSLPGGRYNGIVIEEALNAGYETVFTSEPGFHDGGTTIPRIALTFKNGTRTVESLAADAEGTVRRLRRSHALKSALRKTLGDGLYHRLNRIARGGRGRE